ncbi:MAG TPA: serine hydrolase [Caulobacterales bacterium]|nr:serine hydrolase [Caulobacterales bacterium]
MLTRRVTLLGAAALGACTIDAMPDLAARTLQALETDGMRLGVAALDTGSGHWITHRADERFAMCSTFKLLLVADVLHGVANGGPQLSDQVRFNESDLLDYAPVTRAHVADGPLGRMGVMSVEQLCEAAITLSDNTAANLLLDIVGGPQGLTGFLREQSDGVTRLDRTEPTLNENAPGDQRDTTTPEAMARTMQRLLAFDTLTPAIPGHPDVLGDALTPPLREKLIGWLVACETGKERLRAGFPADWRVGDKTGTGANGAHNDVAIAWPPGRKPILIASYISGDAGDSDTRNAAHASVARVIARAFS